MTLDSLALKYGTDKSSAVHNYARFYDQHFAHRRLEPLRVLEIGIQEGYSLKMWEEYFPNADIIGVDIKDCAHMAAGRITTVRADQSCLKHLKQLIDTFGQFDIIIDDGAHVNKHVLISFETLFPALKSGGIYVIEDLHTLYWGRGFGRPKFLKRLYELVDDINGRGKSGIADKAKNDQLGGYEPKRGKKTWWEDNTASMHLYRSIVFVHKYA